MEAAHHLCRRASPAVVAALRNLQEYVRGLPTIRRQMLWPVVRDAAGIAFHHEALTNITPEILVDAILEVCDGEVCDE